MDFQTLLYRESVRFEFFRQGLNREVFGQFRPIFLNCLLVVRPIIYPPPRRTYLIATAPLVSVWIPLGVRRENGQVLVSSFLTNKHDVGQYFLNFWKLDMCEGNFSSCFKKSILLGTWMGTTNRIKWSVLQFQFALFWGNFGCPLMIKKALGTIKSSSTKGFDCARVSECDQTV